MWSEGAIRVPTEDGKYLAVKYYVIRTFTVSHLLLLQRCRN